MTRYDTPPGPYALDRIESLNGYKIPDLVIQERSTEPVVAALLELATDAQAAAAAAPDDHDLQNYSYALSRHYAMLRECRSLDALAKTAADLDQRLAAWPALEVRLTDDIDAAMTDLRALQTYVKPGRGVRRIWFSPPVDELSRGALDPETVAGLASRIPEIGLTAFIDGVIATLCEAPWAREGDFFHFDYFADPARRLEFLSAAEDLLPKIRALRKLATEFQQHAKLKEEAAKAREKVRDKWAKARGGEVFPVHMCKLIKEILDRRHVAEPDGALTALT